MEGCKNGRGRPKKRIKTEVNVGLGDTTFNSNIQNGGLKLKMRIRSDTDGHQIVEVIKPEEDHFKPSTSKHHHDDVDGEHTERKHREYNPRKVGEPPISSRPSNSIKRRMIKGKANPKRTVSTHDVIDQRGNVKRRGRPKGIKNSISPPKVSVYQGTSTRPSTAILRENDDIMDGEAKKPEPDEASTLAKPTRRDRKPKPKPLNLKFISNLGGGIKLKKGRGRPRKYPRPEDMLNENGETKVTSNENPPKAGVKHIEENEVPKGAKKRKASKPQPCVDIQDESVVATNDNVDSQE